MYLRKAGPAFKLALFVPTFLFGSILLIAQEAVPAEESPPAEYIGSEMCEGCHSDIFEAFQKNPHLAVETDKKRGFEGQACESCHGPGSNHMESMEAADIRNPAKLTPMQADAGCLDCHLNQPTQVGRIRGSHARNQVACVSCHSVHAMGEVLLQPHPRQKINQDCSACHPSVWTSFQRPHAHKLPQGAMSCVDCHNPHGSFLPRNLQTVSANEPGCFRCHGNLRGPFVFEHAPVRFEGCGTCHEPHGSANPRMLTRHDVTSQCLECHANILNATGVSGTGTMGGIPTGNHDLRSSRFQNCTTCHLKVHGSQVSREFLR